MHSSTVSLQIPGCVSTVDYAVNKREKRNKEKPQTL